MPLRIVRDLLTLFLFAGASVSLPCHAQSPGPAKDMTPASLAIVTPVMDCEKLASAEISDAVGATTHITRAAKVLDAKPAPYCDVEGYVEPAVKFEVRLPLKNWTQRFVQTGCGGLCGSLSIRIGNAMGCGPSESGELTLASTDMGHSGGMSAAWGADYQMRIDFAYRGVHVTALAAKALIRAYYGQPAKYSYFSGCSDGGREALMEAQRFPLDFDGIVAGAAAMNFTTQNTFYHGWNAVKNMGVDGKPILTADKLPILHEAALKACASGLWQKFGVIHDPFSCKFDPQVVLCKPGEDGAACLNASQVEVAREIYAGAHTKLGDKLVLSGPLVGSELAWAGVYIPFPEQQQTMSQLISLGTLKYLAYWKNPPADYTLKDLQFTRESFEAATELHGLYDATDPDLTLFAKHGGKLIMFHGLADQHISPLNSIAYYTAMEKLLGKSEVENFARLYLLPGMYHCSGGPGAYEVDLLSPIMAWVERGSAPHELIARHPKEAPPGPMAGAPGMGRPPAGGPPAGGPPQTEAPLVPTPEVDYTRPLYPYPVWAKYDGHGNPEEAGSFSATEPAPVAASWLQWLGAKFYEPHYELWCTGVGSSSAMKCAKNP